MSAFPGIIGFPVYGGFGFNTGGLWGSGIAVLDNADAPKDTAPVRPQSPIERPSNLLPVVAYGTPPGFDAAPPGSVFVYWQMRRYSTIVLAHTVATAPILAGAQTIEIANPQFDPATAARMKEAAEQDILPTVTDWLPGAMESLHFGYFLQEVQWSRVNGRTAPVAYHSVLPGEAVLYRDDFRRLTAFELNGVRRDARYAFLAVNQPHIDPIFGYSRNENCREEWWRIRQSEANADRTERKASGIQMGIGAPIGASFTDDKGNPVFPQDMAQTIVNAVVQGQPFTYPLTPFTKKDIVGNPALADIPAVKIEHFDWGNIGPAIEAHLNRSRELKTGIMRAWCRPEREAMQGTHGTNAESETQGEIGTTDTEMIAAQTMRQYSRQVLNRWAVTNFGPDAANVLAIKQAPLSDPQQKFLQKIAEALVTDRNTGPELQTNINQRALLDRVEIPMVSEADAAKKLADVKAQQQQQVAQSQQQMQLFPGEPGDGTAPPVRKKPDPLKRAAMKLVKRAG